MTTKLEPKDREAQILAAAVAQAIQHGYQNIERQKIADAAGVSPALVSKYLGTMTNVKRDVLRYAVRNRILPIIAQGLAMKDKQAMKAPEQVRKDALATLVK